MGTAFVALLTSKLLWKPCPRVAPEDYVLVRDSSLSQSWPHLELERCGFQSVVWYILKSPQVSSEIAGKMRLQGRKCYTDNRFYCWHTASSVKHGNVSSLACSR